MVCGMQSVCLLTYHAVFLSSLSVLCLNVLMLEPIVRPTMFINFLLCLPTVCSSKSSKTQELFCAVYAVIFCYWL